MKLPKDDVMIMMLRRDNKGDLYEQLNYEAIKG